MTSRVRYVLLLVLAATAAVVLWNGRGPGGPNVTKGWPKWTFREALIQPLKDGIFPVVLEVNVDGEVKRGSVATTIDPDLQESMKKLIDSYAPDYAAFVALDARTGRVLALYSRTRPGAAADIGHLALRATFPAASVFKLVTATAAVDSDKATADTVIAFNGANHTLYRRNVTQNDINRWTRRMTLKEAFAKSVNTVFGKLGLFLLDPTTLAEYSRRYRFNDPILSDLPVEQGHLDIEQSNRWSLAELASGFNRVALMSPVQGALMAAAVANDGLMMEPYLIDRFSNHEGVVEYVAEPRVLSKVMRPTTAEEIRKLMRATVESGTGRKSFRDFKRRRAYAGIDVGGKSGSLNGLNPKGKCDWFVGYARDGEREVAVAALSVNERNWKVKSAYLASKFFELYFKPR